MTRYLGTWLNNCHAIMKTSTAWAAINVDSADGKFRQHVVFFGNSLMCAAHHPTPLLHRQPTSTKRISVPRVMFSLSSIKGAKDL
jgi:hypothetical protein